MTLMLLLSVALNGFLGYTITPTRIEKSLFGAQEITESFEVQNLSTDTLRIKVEFEDFEIDLNGKVVFHPAGTFKNSVASRTVVNPEEFMVMPKSAENVRLTFRMPPDSAAAEYHGMILFKSQPIPTRYKQSITVAGEIGVPIYYAVANLLVRDASFDSFTIAGDSARIVFHNAGNIHVRVKGEAKIVTMDENIARHDSIPEFVVLSGQSRRVTVPLDPNLDRGDYFMRVRLDYGALQLMEGELRFTK